ncbi:MAG: purine-nucleoside phosphorylase [Oscillospiraceae bacterium]|nr:purine-nucleoside phosphorylase [Oscillospiraceae bacterium]
MSVKYKYEDYMKSADYIKERLPELPDTAIILGSGLGGYADSLVNPVVIKYEDIPNFPKSTVSNHKGELVFGGVINNDGENDDFKSVLVMNGRFHFYEGYEMEDTAYPIGVFYLLGIRKIIITNAVGGINLTFHPGDLVCVYDHIKLAPESPVRGANISEFGARFFDMQSVYSKDLIEKAKECALSLGFSLKDGVYAYMSGPQYETPAEIRMLRTVGADLVGMSTVAEVIQAAQCGIKVLCLSCVTNYAAGVTSEPLSHGEVVRVGEEISWKFKKLVDKIVIKI